MEYVKSIDNVSSGPLRLTILGDTCIEYSSSTISKVCYTGPSKPSFGSFGFDRKLNDQLTSDIEAETIRDTLSFTLPGIGKYLTPTFSVAGDGTTGEGNTVVQVDGREQVSGESRLRFNKDIVYTVTDSRCHILRCAKVKDAVWSAARDSGWQAVPLLPEMLSTNQPTNYPDTEGLFALLDGNSKTFFQSTWGSGAYKPVAEAAHIDVSLPYALSRFRIYYRNRAVEDYGTLRLVVYASADGERWELVTTLTHASDGLPLGSGEEYTSHPIDAGADARYLRLEVTEAEHFKRMSSQFTLYYLSWAEMRILEYLPEAEEPQIIVPAEYETSMEPYSGSYTVQVDWLADEATSVPRVDIWTDNGQTPRHVVRDKALDETYWQKARIKISGYGMYDNLMDSIYIKGRGNTSWDGQDKKPFVIKFLEKKKPFGLKAGKKWCIIANAYKGSMMVNAIGMKAARLVGTPAANHIIPIDFYLNNKYMGSYTFTEKIGISNNSIDIDEDTGILLELDQYFDEYYRFNSKPYALPVNIKEPNLQEMSSDEANTLFNSIQKDFNTLCKSIVNNSGYEYLIDIPSFARFMMVNTLILNYEICHPKSTFVYKTDIHNPSSQYVFGPVWDFDWAYGYENTSNYYISSTNSSIYGKSGGGWEGTSFLKVLMKGSDDVGKKYYQVWRNFVDNDLQELLDYVDDYYSYAAPSFARNQNLWGDGKDYGTQVSQIKKWLNERTAYIMANIEVYDLDEDDVIHAGDDTGVEDVDNQLHAPIYQIYVNDGQLIVETMTPSDISIYSLQGICVKTVHLEEGINKVALPTGLYIVDGRKIAINLSN